jgi:hypothetical protein
MLRSHGEQRWLTAQVLPVLRQLERPGTVPDDQLGAALAYLEVLWLDAQRRAAVTDATLAQLLVDDPRAQRPFHAHACRYQSAVRALRDAVAERVRRATAPPGGAQRHQHATL